jgi:hypothetical protein
VAALARQEGALLLRLHAFGDHLQPQAVARPMMVLAMAASLLSVRMSLTNSRSIFSSSSGSRFRYDSDE